MHQERQVRLGLRGEDAGRSETGVVDERRVVLADPLDGVRIVRHDGVHRLFVPVLRVQEGVLAGDVEAVVGNAVKEHVYA